MNFDLDVECSGYARLPEGTTGTMVNRETGLRIHGTVMRFTRSRDEFGFRIDGTQINNAFRVKSWIFYADKPTFKQEFSKLEIGEDFILRGGSSEWLSVKIDSDTLFWHKIRDRDVLGGKASTAWRTPSGEAGKASADENWLNSFTISRLT